METQKALFMGRITAGVTHEIKNVLAIIKESAGLIEDLLSLWQKDSQIQTEKLSKTLTKIIDQVDRGVELSTKLNEFAHTPDQEVADVNLNSAVEKVVSLSQRFARLKRIRLEASKKNSQRSISTDPLCFLMLMFSGIELLMDIVGQNGVISVEPCLEGRDIVTISGLPLENESTIANVRAAMQSEDFRKMLDLAGGINMSVSLESTPLRIVVADKLS